MVDVSIVVPTYNVEKYLSASLNSILAQTHTNIEIILVDDGSTDSSGKMCDEFAEKDSRIRVVHKENGGLSSARNAGLDEAIGKYVYFCDSDDIIKPNLVSDNFKLLEKYEAEICVFGHEIVKYKGDTLVTVKNVLPPATVCLDYKGFWDNYRMVRHVGHTAWNRMFLRSYLVENNLRYCVMQTSEDTQHAYDTFDCGFNKIIFNSGIYYSYVQRPGSIMSVYKEDRLDLTLMLSDRLKDIIERRDPVKGRYEDLINLSYVLAALGSFRYLTVLSPVKLYTTVRKYMKRSVLRKSFSEVGIKQIEDSKSKIGFFLLKYRMFMLYTAVFYLYKFYKEYREVLVRN